MCAQLCYWLKNLCQSGHLKSSIGKFLIHSADWVPANFWYTTNSSSSLTCLTMCFTLEQSQPVEETQYPLTPGDLQRAYHLQTWLPVEDISLAIQFDRRHSTQVNSLDTKCDTASFTHFIHVWSPCLILFWIPGSPCSLCSCVTACCSSVGHCPMLTVLITDIQTDTRIHKTNYYYSFSTYALRYNGSSFLYYGLMVE